MAVKITFQEVNGDYIVLSNGQRVGVVIPIADKWTFGADDETVDNLHVPMSVLNWQNIIAEWLAPQLEEAIISLEDHGHGEMVVIYGDKRIGFVYFRHNIKTDTNWWEFRTGDFMPVELTGIIPTGGLQNVRFLERIRRAIESYWLNSEIA